MERAPLLVNSNRWLAFHDDPNIPTNALSGETKTIVLGLLFGKSDGRRGLFTESYITGRMWRRQGVDAEAVDGKGWQILDWDDGVLSFDQFGSKWMKIIWFIRFLSSIERNWISWFSSQATTVFPDAIHPNSNTISMVQTRGEFTAIVYETVLAQMFKRGGTESLPAFSRESRH